MSVGLHVSDLPEPGSPAASSLLSCGLVFRRRDETVREVADRGLADGALPEVASQKRELVTPSLAVGDQTAHRAATARVSIPTVRRTSMG